MTITAIVRRSQLRYRGRVRMARGLWRYRDWAQDRPGRAEADSAGATGLAEGQAQDGPEREEGGG